MFCTAHKLNSHTHNTTHNTHRPRAASTHSSRLQSASCTRAPLSTALPLPPPCWQTRRCVRSGRCVYVCVAVSIAEAASATVGGALPCVECLHRPMPDRKTAIDTVTGGAISDGGAHQGHAQRAGGCAARGGGARQLGPHHVTGACAVFLSVRHACINLPQRHPECRGNDHGCTHQVTLTRVYTHAPRHRSACSASRASRASSASSCATSGTCESYARLHKHTLLIAAPEVTCAAL